MEGVMKSKSSVHGEPVEPYNAYFSEIFRSSFDKLRTNGELCRSSL
jgi:hypothetical protein